MQSYYPVTLVVKERAYLEDLSDSEINKRGGDLNLRRTKASSLKRSALFLPPFEPFSTPSSRATQESHRHCTLCPYTPGQPALDALNCSAVGEVTAQCIASDYISSSVN
jgi:hypothetical protein